MLEREAEPIRKPRIDICERGALVGYGNATAQAADRLLET